MSPEQQSVLLLAALVCWYVYHVRTSPPVLRICPGCGDRVYFTPGLWTRCPSCKRLTLI